jgi:hypothetical protein
MRKEIRVKRKDIKVSFKNRPWAEGEREEYEKLRDEEWKKYHDNQMKRKVTQEEKL